MSRLGCFVCAMALLTALGGSALAAQATASDKDSACTAAREQARKEAGKGVKLTKCECQQPKANGAWVCTVSPL